MAKMGRPTKYNEELADDICEKIASGLPLTKICKPDNMPKLTTVYRWLQEKADFREMYTRAREDQADTLADEMAELADIDPERILSEGGNKIDAAYVNWMRLRIDTRKWTASKLKPRKYGDKTFMAGDAENPIKHDHDLSVFGTLLESVLLKRQEEIE